MTVRRALAAALVALLAAPLLAADLPRAVRGDWQWVENENIRVLTGESVKEAERLIDDLERFRVAVSEMLPRFDPALAPRPTFIVFDGDRTFDPYKPRDAYGKSRDVVATFYARELAPQGALTGRSELSDRILHRAYFNVLFRHALVGQPYWLQSGLADFFSTFHLMSRSGEAQIGRAVPHYYDGWFPDLLPPPVALLLEITRDDRDYQAGNQGLNFRARAWLLVHYLQIGPKGVPGALGKFLELRARGVEADAALEAVTGTKLVDLDRDLNSYVARARVAVLGVDLSDVVPSPVTVRRAATRAEVLFELGVLAGYTAEDRPELAAAHFDAIEALEPGSSLAALGRGRLAYDGKEWGKAAEQFARAADTEPESVDALVGLAFAARRAMWSGKVELDPALLASARRAAVRAVELAPGRAESWEALVGLRRGEAAGEALEETLALFERGHELRPGDHEVSEVLVDLYVEAGRTKDARLLAESVLRADSTPSGRLERTVVRLDVRDARELARAGEVETALGQLEWRLRHTQDEEARATVGAAIAELRAGAGEDEPVAEPATGGSAR